MKDRKYFAILKQAKRYAYRQRAFGYKCVVKKCILGGEKPYFVEITSSDLKHI